MATSDDGTDDRTEQLEARVAELEEQLDDLKTAGDVATDAQGRQWSAADFMNVGLTRRQALGAIAALASGAALHEAFQQAVGVAEAAGSSQVGTIGEPGSPVDAYIEDLYDTNDNPVLEFNGDGSIVSVSTDQAVSPEIARLPAQHKFDATDATNGITLPSADLVTIFISEVQSSNNNALRMQLSDDGGTTWLSSDHRYSYESVTSGGVSNGANDDTDTDHIELTSTTSTSTARRTKPLRIDISTNAGERAHVSWIGTGGDVVPARVYGSGYQRDTVDHDAVRFFTDDGSGGVTPLNVIEGYVQVIPGDVTV